MTAALGDGVDRHNWIRRQGVTITSPARARVGTGARARVAITFERGDRRGATGGIRSPLARRAPDLEDANVTLDSSLEPAYAAARQL